MAADFTLKARDHLGLVGGAMGKVHAELARVNAGTANTATTYELSTNFHRVVGASFMTNGTAGNPFLDEFGNVDGDGVIKGSASGVTLKWATAPKGTDYFVMLYGY